MLLITARMKRLLSKMDLQPMATLVNWVYSIIYILHTHTHTHTYIYIYIHTHTHTHTLRSLMTCTPYLGYQIEKSETGRTCSTYGGEEKVLMGKPEREIPLGRPRCRREDNIKMDLQEVGWRKWTGLIWLRIGTGGRHL
jgi:hypothetical protein